MMDVMPGSIFVKCNLALTGVFVAMSIVAAVTFTSPWKTIGVVVSLSCFSVGIVAFLWGYWTAVQRSRTDNISVAALYFLVDKCAPQSVARLMNGALGLQVVVAVGTAISRTSTDGRAGSTLAFGVLAPMMGLGLNGLWGATYGTFTPRQFGDSDEVPLQEPASGQD
ncbi:MAG: hypothetical protein RL374_1307 [Actinomycetota bacterium]|jgi:hypothetical protein